MQKVFFIKRKEQSQIYQLNLTNFSTDTDYKFILNLLVGGKHKNFINGMLTQTLAYDILCYYLFIRKSLHAQEDEFCFTLYKCITKEIGLVGHFLFLRELNENVDDVFFIQKRPKNLNKFKI